MLKPRPKPFLDARSATIARLREVPADSVTMAFGTEGEMWLATGVRRSLAARAGEPAWRAVRQFLNGGETVFGYLGFGLNDPRGVLKASPAPDLYLFVPERIERFLPTAAPATSYAPACGSVDPAFVEKVAHVSRWIGGGARRLTIAREMALAGDVDLREVIGAPIYASVPDVYRSFYFRLPGATEFAGNCPETLALSDDARTFFSHKLSGTFGRSEDPREDREMLARLLTDPKLEAEHEGSLAGLTKLLGEVGEVDRVRSRAVLELLNLRHYLTTLRTRLRPGFDRVDFLRKILPAGGPMPDALPVLAEVESFARGPYYGLCGVFHPNGGMALTQVLRSVFREADRTVIRVGCAVTAGTTAHWSPEDEERETRWKAANVYLPTMAANPARQ